MNAPAFAVPTSYAELFSEPVLAPLCALLLPAQSAWPTTPLAIEVEAEGTGTFAITLAGGAVTVKKGMHKAPLLTVVLPRTGLLLLQKEIAAALADFSDAPALRATQQRLRAMPTADMAAVLAALSRLPSVAFAFDVVGYGRFWLAKGTPDEADHELTVAITGQAIERVLVGAPLSVLAPKLGGDRQVLPQVLLALRPLVDRLTGDAG